MRLVLASASPRRAELLHAAGFEFDTVAVAVDETIRADESPAAYVGRLAAEKSARALSALAEGPHPSRHPRIEDIIEDIVVLGADTTVVVGDEILGKPRDERDAAVMLRKLSGRRHDVMTAVSLRRGAVEVGRAESTAVYFAPLTDDDVTWYIASKEWQDKAGAYAIQGLASRFIPRIEGSYSNVVGLPVACVFELLRRLTR